MNQLLILAGGMGTRLRDRLNGLPKPLIPIGGRPLLAHQVELAKKHGFYNIVVFVGYKANAIIDCLGDGGEWGVRIRYEVEQVPLGTAGAVLSSLDRLDDEFVVMYGDTMVNVDLGRLCDFHKRECADATLLLHPNNHPMDSDLVEIADNGDIVAFHNRPHPEDTYRQNLVNAGLYVVLRRALAPFVGAGAKTDAVARGDSRSPSIATFDFGSQLFPAMLKNGARLKAYHSPEYIKDIGTPNRYDRVCSQYAAGIVQRGSLDVRQAAVFLDRDGTLIEEVGRHGVTAAGEVRLIPNVANAVCRLNDAGIRVVLVTNQPVIAKGFVSEAQLKYIHNTLETLLGRSGAFLDRIYWCPHHPEGGHPGERVELKVPCTCRKPNIGLISQAAKDLNVDLANSWMIGDTTTDMQTGKNAGLRSILVSTGYAGRDGKYSVSPDFVSSSLSDAVELVLREDSR
ncbi:MAG: HAD-IIIA family hydrolase [Armatimonadota bacterium]|nr:HAD-IIIA family hydrolase [Armatimonadota bacterium]